MKQERQCTEHNTEARSLTFLPRRAKSIKYSDCVCSLHYLAQKALAWYYIVICGPSVSTQFFHIISQTA